MFYLTYRIGFEHSEKWDNLILNIIENKKAKIKTFSISYDEGDKKTDFFVMPYLINSDFINYCIIFKIHLNKI